MMENMLNSHDFASKQQIPLEWNRGNRVKRSEKTESTARTCNQTDDKYTYISWNESKARLDSSTDTYH
jgi:hypothetical protein